MNKTLPEEAACPAEAGETELPAGWTETPLSQICEINPRKPSRDDLKANDLVTFVPMPAVDADAGAITSPQERRFAEVRTGFTAFRNRDVIMAKITPCMENGKAAIASGLTSGFGFGSTEFHVLRSTGAVLPEFVYYFIRQQSFRRAAESEMTGSVGQKRVPTEFLRGAEIPLPPLAEQKRIVARVEELLACTNVVLGRLASVRATLRRFRHAVLAAATSGGLTAGWREATGTDMTGWTTTSLGALVLEAANGLAKRRGDSGTERVVLRLADFKNAKRVFGNERKIRLTDGEFRKYSISSGDLLVIRVNGSRDLAGRFILFETALPQAETYCDHFIRLRLDGAKALPLFVSFVGNSGAGRAHVEGELVTSAGQNTISQAPLLSLPILLPPLIEQSEILRRVGAVFKFADNIEKRAATATARVDRLAQAILAKAFCGELVPTEAELARREGREYESASALLERMRGESAVADTKGDGPRGARARAGDVASRCSGARKGA